MAMAALTEQQALRSAGLWARIATPILFAAVALPLIGRLYLGVFEPAGGVVAWPAIVAIVLEALPPLILSWSMLGLAGVFAEYEMGRYVSRKASAAMKRAGMGATIALLLQAFVVPLALAAINGQPLQAAINPNVFDLAVMIFASAMLAIGRALEAAAKELQHEVDQMV